MLRLKCVNCGLIVPYKGSAGGVCPRCVVHHGQAIDLITVSDEPSSAAGRTSGSLAISARVDGGCHTILLSGELDITSYQMLEEAVSDAAAADASRLVIDLSSIEFMDSTGLNAILRARSVCEESGCECVLTPAQRPVERVLEVTGIRRALQHRPRTHHR